MKKHRLCAWDFRHREATYLGCTYLMVELFFYLNLLFKSCVHKTGQLVELTSCLLWAVVVVKWPRCSNDLSSNPAVKIVAEMDENKQQTGQVGSFKNFRQAHSA